jgi:two-component system sensor histidine kinase UhpB
MTLDIGEPETEPSMEDSPSVASSPSQGQALTSLTARLPTPQRRIATRLLSLSLFYKVLVANSAIVLLGALAGTAITLRVASQPGHTNFDVPLAAIFAVCGLALTGLLNALVLRAAFSPLSRLQEVARRVHEGDLSVRAEPSPLADAEIAQIAGTLNQVLDEVQAYEEQMRALSGRVIRAQEEERQRIARELHDDTGQVLTLLLIRLKLLEPQAGTDALREQITELRGLVSGAIDQVRQMALNLRPPSLDQLGLLPALRSLVTTYTTSTHIQVKLELPREPVTLSPERTIAVYRVAQEALTNIAKHSGARSVAMSLTREGDMLHLAIRDDGKGFDLSTLLHRGQRGANGGPGVGLFGMEERARLASGTLHLQSAPGRGTVIDLRLPAELSNREVTNAASTALA